LQEANDFERHSSSSEITLFDRPRITHFLLVFSSNNITILHRFQDNAALTAYATACDLEKSFGFDSSVKIIGQTDRQTEMLHEYRAVRNCAMVTHEKHGHITYSIHVFNKWRQCQRSVNTFLCI